MESLNTIVGKIESVNVVKSGTTNGRNWTIYEVIVNGEKFRTFDSQFQNLIGQTKELKYEVRETTTTNGRVFVNKTLINLPKAKTIDASEVKFNTLNDKLDKIIGILEKDDIPIVEEPPKPEPTPEDFPPEEEIPF